MKFSFEWIKSITKTQKSASEIASLLTMHFAETTTEKNGKRFVLNVDILANRVADASSHLGLAREISAILNKKFTYPPIKIKEEKEEAKNCLKITIKSNNCHSYLARVIKDVRVKPSPLWLQKRLRDCGLRPINNIVDASNYVMLETGQPLHAFDYDKVDKGLTKKNIIIRSAKPKEKITTLENKSYSLFPEATIIADSNSPLALAGIKGGKIAEVDSSTKNIILESANFSGVNVRRTSKRLGLVTDASIRFEHNLQISLSEYALDRVAELIQQIGGGKILKGRIGKESKKKPLIIPLKQDDWQKQLGINISSTKAIRYLTMLGFIVKNKQKYILVTPPPYRNDIKIKEDVIGEIFRLSGVNELLPVFPKEEISLPPRNEFWQFRQEIKKWLMSDKLDEIQTYSFISDKDKHNINTSDLIEVMNPTSETMRYLRPSLIPNLLKTISLNSHWREHLGFFEIGNVYYKEKNKFREKFNLSIGLYSGTKSNVLFYQMRGIIEDLLSRWGVASDDYDIKEIPSGNYYHFWFGSGFKSGAILQVNNKTVAIYGIPSRKIANDYKIKGTTFLAEIDLPLLFQLVNSEIDYEPLPKYPAIIRDISLLVHEDVPIGAIMETIQLASPKYLEDIDLFDIYEGDKSLSSKKSLAFHLRFRSLNHTLTSKEIDKAMENIKKALLKINCQIR